MTNRSEVTVQTFIDRVSEPLSLEIVAGLSGTNRILRSSRIQKPGLALVGHLVSVHSDRVQVLGKTELSFLDTLSPEQQRKSIDELLALELACILSTKNL